jgi:capsular polysaccharide transport system permease protein
MNMHGFIVPDEQKQDSRGNVIRRTLDWMRHYRAFLLVVILPTALVSAYYYLIAADQYESEAHFLVRSAGQSQAAGIGISQALSAATGISSAQGEAISVSDYLTSHDVVNTLRAKGDLVARFQRPEADLISRLRGSNPSPERLLKYFLSRVSVKYNTETGITVLTVHTFQRADSLILAEQLLKLGEARVNMLNQRNFRDSIANANQDLATTEVALEQLQRGLTQFRQSRRDIDPQASGQAQIELVSRLTGDLSAARSQLSAMGRMIRADSPQYVALAARVKALEAQVNAQSTRLTGSDRAIATDISGYEDLRMRKDFLTKRYEAAAAALDKARDQAQRQQLYIVRVVEPNLPVKSLYPQRARVVLTVFIGLLLVYALGWLVVAGTKEHAA